MKTGARKLNPLEVQIIIPQTLKTKFLPNRGFQPLQRLEIYPTRWNAHRLSKI